MNSSCSNLSLRIPDRCTAPVLQMSISTLNHIVFWPRICFLFQYTECKSTCLNENAFSIHYIVWCVQFLDQCSFCVSKKWPSIDSKAVKGLYFAKLGENESAERGKKDLSQTLFKPLLQQNPLFACPSMHILFQTSYICTKIHFNFHT